VYVWETVACTCPVHRAENPSAGTPDAGAPVPKVKFTVASLRVSARLVRLLSEK
jgi:hypothetical protein